MVFRAQSWFYVQLKQNSVAIRIGERVFNLNEQLLVNYDAEAFLLQTSEDVKYISRLQSDRQERWTLLSHSNNPFGISFQHYRLAELWNFCRIQPISGEQIGPAHVFWLPPTQRIRIQICFEVVGKKHLIYHEHSMEHLSLSLRFQLGDASHSLLLTQPALASVQQTALHSPPFVETTPSSPQIPQPAVPPADQLP